MKNLLTTLLLFFFTHSFLIAQLHTDIPLPLQFGKVKFRTLLDGFKVAETDKGIELTTILLTDQYFIQKRGIVMGGGEREVIYGLAKYSYDKNFNLIDSSVQLFRIRTQIFKSGYDLIQKGEDDIFGGTTIATEKDFVSAASLGLSNSDIDEGFYPPRPDRPLFKTTEKTPLPKDLPPILYTSYISSGFTGKLKEFVQVTQNLKNDVDRQKAAKSFFSDGINGQYTAVKKPIKMDDFLKDPKNQKIFMGGKTYCHELTGTLLACLVHYEKVHILHYSFWGFDAEGNTLNSYYKDFTESMAMPTIHVLNEPNALVGQRPKAMATIFTSSKNSNGEFNLVIQDKDGKVTSDRTFKLNGNYEIPHETILIDGNNSLSLSTLTSEKNLLTYNTYLIKGDDPITSNSYPLTEINYSQKFPKRILGSAQSFKLEDNLKVKVLPQMFIESIPVKGQFAENTEIFYTDGLLATTVDAKNKIIDVYHLGKDIPGQSGTAPLSTYHFKGTNGIHLILVQRPTSPSADFPTASNGFETLILQVDQNGKISSPNNNQLIFTKNDEFLTQPGNYKFLYAGPGHNSVSMLRIKN